MNTTVAEKNEAQDQEPKNRYSIDESQDALYEHQSRAGSSPMRCPTKDALVKHIAQNTYHLGEATEILGSELDLPRRVGPAPGGRLP
jgi:hypothetical protein